MHIIGITGNIGSGKSLAASILGELGAAVIDADQIGRRVLTPGRPAYDQVAQAFGPAYLLPDGSVDRRALAAYVFAAPERVALLNSITHPCITQDIREELRRLEDRGCAIVVIEAALLFDTELCRMTDENWLIIADRQALLERAAARDNSTLQAAAARLQAQRPAEQLASLADVVIANNGSPLELRAMLTAEYERVLKDRLNEQ